MYLVPLLLVCLALAWYWQQRTGGDAGSAYRTASVERGDIRVSISATGTLGAISTVEVGSQISGLVTEVLADFNDTVSKGQVIARIDPSTFDAQIVQGNAAVEGARASLATARATLANAEADYRRKSALGERQLVATSDIDVARAARDQARAQISSAQAQITQQRASTQSSQLNLERTEIRSPVDGVVLTRTVEPGQTVAASLQAPVLFQIAEDLSKMEIVLAIDEADIGQVKTGQGVSFGVDAYTDRQFRGTVQQVRLSATDTNNVITYPVVVAVDNADQTLLPGMTANAEIEVSRREDVLRVPNAALRYKPADSDAIAPVATAVRTSPSDELPGIAEKLDLNIDQQTAFNEALEAMRERAAARRPVAPTSGGGRAFGPSRGNANRGGGNSGAMRQRMQEHFNQQFAPFRDTLTDEQAVRWDGELASLLAARRAPLYVLVAGNPVATNVRVGVSDGSWTEVTGDIAQDDQLIIGRGRPAR